MSKRIILIAILFLGCSISPYKNESKATINSNSAADSGSLNNSRGHKNKSPYKIVNSRYVSRSSLKRLPGSDYGVRIRILQNGMDNTEIEDLFLAYDSGMEYRMGNTYGIEHSRFPLYVKVTYKSWNTFHAVQSDVIYEFVIYAPGMWDVTICN
jgi:hypothetical protein